MIERIMRSSEITLSGLIVPSGTAYDNKRKMMSANGQSRKPSFVLDTKPSFNTVDQKILAIMADLFVRIHGDENPPLQSIVQG